MAMYYFLTLFLITISSLDLFLVTEDVKDFLACCRATIFTPTLGPSCFHGWLAVPTSKTPACLNNITEKSTALVVNEISSRAE